MGGSKKGERRGNARKRPAGWKRTHETPGEIMRDTLRKHHSPPVVVERRIQVSRMILGNTGAVEDITPKEALLQGMQYHLQAHRDWIDAIEHLSSLPVTEETARLVEHAEHEAERHLAQAGEFSFKVCGYIHPKLQAMAINTDTGANQASILQALFDDIDERERAQPIPIEHKPDRRTG